MRKVIVNGDALTIEDVVDVARGEATAELSDSTAAAMEPSRSVVAAVMEALAHLSPVTPVRSLRQSQDAAALAQARTCYDHLAGRAGVALLDALLARRLLVAPPTDGLPERFEVTTDGLATLSSFGLDIGTLKRTRRRFAGACLDWTERKPHLNGALGAAVTARLFGLGWLERGSRRRAVRVTPAGAEGLAATFGWSLEG